MNFEKSFGTYDIKSLAEWFEHEDGGKFLIAPLNNNVQMQETLKNTKVKQDDDAKTLYDSKEVSCRVMAKSILIGWSDIKTPDGNDLKYTPVAAEKALVKYDEFSTWVLKMARELSDQNAKEKEATVKN